MPGSTKAGGDTDDSQRSEVVARLLRGELGMHEACERYGLTPETIGDWVRDFRRSTLRAFDEHVRATLSRQGVDIATFSAAELTGTLDEVAVSDLIQTIELSRRDCEITVTHAGIESRLWCSGGEIVAAESGKLSGEPALYRILALEQGEVFADFRPVRRARTIWRATPVLLLDGARRKDECNRLRSRLGHERYAPGSNPKGVDATLTPAEVALLRAFEGPRSVGDVLAASPWGDLETLTAFASLVGRERLLPAAPADEPSPAAPQHAISLRPVLVSLLALAPGVSRARRHDAMRSRLGMFMAGGLLAVVIVPWLLRAGSERHTERSGSMLEPIPVLAAPEASAEGPTLQSPEAAALAPVLDAAPTSREPALAEVAEPVRADAARPQPSAPEPVEPRASRARLRAPQTARVAEPLPALPRMQIIEDRTPTMRILE